MLRAGKHDGVIAWGGGSGIDTAKAIAFMAGQTRPMWDFEDIGDWWTRANPAGILPSIAVPTTAGTGSETGRASVITDEATHTKKVIFHPKMMPAIVIADPELTVGLPPKLTAGTGMDAFIHCFEAYCAPGYHPYAEGIAVEGMRLVKENLARAVKDGRDIEARGHMLAASQMGSTAFQKGLGAIHSLSHPVGRDARHASRPDQRRGHALCAEVQSRGDRGQDRAAGALARPAQRRPSTASCSGRLDLRREIGIPHTLAELGVKIEPSRQVLRDGRGRSDGRRQPGQGRRAGDAQDVRGGREREVVMALVCWARATPRGRVIRCNPQRPRHWSGALPGDDMSHSPPRPASSSSAAASWAARRPITWPSTAGRTSCCSSRGG